MNKYTAAATMGGRYPPHRKSQFSPHNKNAQQRLARYADRVPTDTSTITHTRDERLVAALAMRSYHLPDHTYCDDWLQYLQNNHPIFGICCHYRAHPIKTKLRLLFLLGSILFGLAVTNVVWLLFYYNQQDYDAPAITINLNGFGNSTTVGQETSANDDTTSNGDFEVTQGMLVLWTFGGALHALFDNTIWYLSACICCLSRKRQQMFTKFQQCATYCLVFLVLLLTGVATLAVLLRTSLEQELDNSSESSTSNIFTDDDAATTTQVIGQQVRKIRLFDVQAYAYLVSYVAEFVLALFVYYPLVGSFFFSGVLGCGNIPFLGGRPYEVKVEARQQQQLARQRERLEQQQQERKRQRRQQRNGKNQRL